MSEKKLSTNLLSLGAGVEACIEKRLIIPALILIYSAIDTTGWLASSAPFATRHSFINWTENYLLRTTTLQCTAIELYAARCGLLHTLTPNSQLSVEGKARRICYVWGEGRVQQLQRMIDLSNNQTKYVAVGVVDLFEAWRLGLKAFFSELEVDSARSSQVFTKAKHFFSEWGAESVEELISALESDADRTHE